MKKEELMILSSIKPQVNILKFKQAFWTWWHKEVNKMLKNYSDLITPQVNFIFYLGWLVLEWDDTSLNHLVVKIVSFASPFSNSGKDRVTTMSLGHVVNQFHDQHSLAHSGTAEQTNLTSLKYNDTLFSVAIY